MNQNLPPTYIPYLDSYSYYRNYTEVYYLFFDATIWINNIMPEQSQITLNKKKLIIPNLTISTARAIIEEYILESK